MIETERLDGGAPPWVRREHEARYRFASRYVEGRTVVDCACGTGAGARRFLAAGARRLLGFDASRAAVEVARRNVDDPRAQLSVASGTALPVASGTAEVFVSLETIEHVDADGAFLDEVVRVLAPAGTFVCSTPNRAVSNPGLPRGGAPVNPFHVREYSARELEELLAARFRRVALYGQNPVSSRVAAALGLAGRLAPFRIVTRARQLAKARYLLPPLWREHEVQELRPGRDYEYLVAVCSNA